MSEREDHSEGPDGARNGVPGSEFDARVVDLEEERRARAVAERQSSPPPQPRPPARPAVTFDRRELDRILRVYGRKVAEGEWRDYAMDFDRDRATFSCYRRSSEVPQFRIVKDPRLARKQGAWSVVSAAGAVLKRGRELDQVLRVFDKKPKAIS